MLPYSVNDARDWAREKLIGVSNVTLPTMTSDFKRLNERAIRHDVELAIEQGFTGSLACSEVANSLEDYRQLCELMVDQARGRLMTVHHAVFNTLEDNIEALRIAEEAGAELVLLGYPPYFYPQSLEEVCTYTKAFCDATKLAVMLFPIPTWGFQRLDPADMPIALIRRLIDECPNIVAIKAEGGMPYIMSSVEVHQAFHKEVVISFPVEYDMVPLAQLIPVPYCGTNYSSYFGPWLPRVHALLQAGRYAEATAEWYKADPARKAAQAAPMSASGLINRMLWKYQGWLQGYNGGPLRHPTARIYAKDMTALRRGLELSGLEPTPDADASFFIGRNPE
ncbi:4-hydroxy-tetrahydrodipicolinate synthase [Sphingobium faniae]|nr:4-hydroxy-tetrahydrodipicolinate synthase [Sphingobium faniae]